MQPLTPRERTVLKGIADGLRNKEIAFNLGLTEDTVKCYTSRLCMKLGVYGRVNLASWARHAGVVEGTLSAFENVRVLLMTAEFTIEQARDLLYLILERSHKAVTPTVEELISCSNPK